MKLKEVVQLAYHSVGSLTTISSLVCEEVNLARERFTVYAKNTTLPGSEKEYGSRLEGIGRIVNLLGIVEIIMRPVVIGIGRNF